MKTVVWNTLSAGEKATVLARPVFTSDAEFATQVATILRQVKQQGDAALRALTSAYDQVDITNLQVTPAELQSAVNTVTPEAKAAIQFAKNQITTYHRATYPVDLQVETQPGVVCSKQYRAIESVGLYIPGGSAPLVSTLLMLAVPAQLANCQNRVVTTPANATGNIDPNLLYAAELCGINTIYKVGGAQAIAALAYGTESICKVNKIFGPGNRWVTQAKLHVANDPAGASIDLPAGPSEVMVIADEQADPVFVAADLLSQAEHGSDSQVMLVCLSQQFAQQVITAIQALLQNLDRNTIIMQALQNSRIIVVDDVTTAIAISNAYAPEHLILQIEQPQRVVAAIQHAGAVFLGKWSPEAVGDYVTGSNHVLPTYGYAKNYSGLAISDFMKAIHFQTVTQQGLAIIAPYAKVLAELEGLTAHKLAVSVRCEAMTCKN